MTSCVTVIGVLVTRDWAFRQVAEHVRATFVDAKAFLQFKQVFTIELVKYQNLVGVGLILNLFSSRGAAYPPIRRTRPIVRDSLCFNAFQLIVVPECGGSDLSMAMMGYPCVVLCVCARWGTYRPTLSAYPYIASLASIFHF